MAAVRHYSAEPLRAGAQQGLIDALRDSVAHDHRTFEQILTITGLSAAELRNLLDRG
jgi:hypothetical protein